MKAFFVSIDERGNIHTADTEIVQPFPKQKNMSEHLADIFNEKNIVNR